MEDNITLTEYQNSLEAYGVTGETHFDPNGSDYYVMFEHRAMFKLIEILESRGISHQDFFHGCDKSGDEMI